MGASARLRQMIWKKHISLGRARGFGRTHGKPTRDDAMKGLKIMGHQRNNIFRYRSGADNTSKGEGSGSTTSVYVVYSTTHNNSRLFQER